MKNLSKVLIGISAIFTVLGACRIAQLIIRKKSKHTDDVLYVGNDNDTCCDCDDCCCCGEFADIDIVEGGDYNE